MRTKPYLRCVRACGTQQNISQPNIWSRHPYTLWTVRNWKKKPLHQDERRKNGNGGLKNKFLWWHVTLKMADFCDKKTRKKQIVHAHQKLENSTLLTEFLHCLELMVRKRQATRWQAASVVTGLSEPGGGSYGPSRFRQINQPYLNQGGILCPTTYYLSPPPRIPTFLRNIVVVAALQCTRRPAA